MEVEPERVRFPARCVRCGGSPSRHVTLSAWRGWDLLYIRWGRTCEVPVPVCQRCAGRRLRNRVGWFVAVIGSMVAIIVAGALLADTLDETSKSIVAGVLVASLVPFIWIFRAREAEWFQRAFDPVSLRRWRPKENRVELCFRDQALAHDVGLLSGLVADPPREANYREPAKVDPPPAWSGPNERPLPWWVALVVGGLMFAVAIGEFIQYSGYERTGRGFSDEQLFIWLYELGGKWLLSGFLGAIGAACIAAAFVFRRRGGIPLTGRGWRRRL